MDGEGEGVVERDKGGLKGVVKMRTGGEVEQKGKKKNREGEGNGCKEELKYK